MTGKRVFAIIVILAAVLMAAWIAVGYFSVRGLEGPEYSVEEKKEGYEIRRYSDYVVAETTVEGDYAASTSDGFRRLFDYISGNNTSRKAIAMTAPVVSQNESLSEKIAMTTPVISAEGKDRWSLAFVMPSRYTLDTLPVPLDNRVKMRRVPGETVAVSSFSWYVSEARLGEKSAELAALLNADGRRVRAMKSARYDPPFSPPFMKRNEVWAVLEE